MVSEGKLHVSLKYSIIGQHESKLMFHQIENSDKLRLILWNGHPNPRVEHCARQSTLILSWF
jgi:hypothetical protein